MIVHLGQKYCQAIVNLIYRFSSFTLYVSVQDFLKYSWKKSKNILR